MYLPIFLVLIVHAVANLQDDTFAISHVRSYACLGDSYAAGIGAGHPRLSHCGQFSDAYPQQIARNSSISIVPICFRNLACGGTTSRTVLYQQVPWIGDADVVTLTVGGNEVDFFPLLNECVYQWAPKGDCPGELAKVRSLLQSPQLLNNYHELLAGAASKLKAGALLLVTGYARFFNEETNLCDQVTFSRTRPLDRLTKEKRRGFNELVGMLNVIIRSTAEAHGAIYVDIDTLFEEHRFCEEGVMEPDLGREATWFFNLEKPEIEMRHERMAGQATFFSAEDAEVQWLGDLKSIRTFHPTSLGHKAIADEIVRMVLEQKSWP